MLAVAAGLAGCTVTDVRDQLLPPPPEVLPDLGGRELAVAVFANYAPYSQIDPNTGVVQGFDYDFITALAARLDFQPRFVAADPNLLLADLAAGRYDVAGGGIAYTLDRAATLDFAAPYRLEKQRVAVRASEQRITTIAAFHDATALRVGATTGTTSYDTAVAFLGAARVAAFSTYAAALDALATDSLDGVILDETELTQAQTRRPGVFKALPGPVAGNVSAYALPLGSELTTPLNDAFQQLQAEGAVAALREKWGL
jgi:cyclohexadienyl dehydratase